MIEQKKDAMRREVSAQTSEEDLVIPGGMPVGIYMKTKGVMVLDTQKIKGKDGAEYEPALHIVKAGITSLDLTAKISILKMNWSKQ